MATTIICHIGDSKTGSSYIQNFLDVNRAQLSSSHLCLYPNFASEDLAAGRCHNHSEWFHKVKNKGAQLARDIKRLKRYTKSHEIDKVVLSDESWFLDKNVIDFFHHKSFQKNGFSIKVIGYIRRIDFWFESAWKQWGLKQFESPEDYAKLGLTQDHYQGLFNQLEKWADIIGQENIIVRPYEKGQLTGGLLDDFMSSAGIEYLIYQWKDVEDEYGASNRGFNRDVLEVLHYCQDLFENVHDNHLFDLFASLLGDDFSKQPFEDYALLSPEQRLQIINNNQPFEKKIAEKYMGRSDGKIFYDPLPDPKEPWQPYEGLTLAKVLPILIKMIESNYRLHLDNVKKLKQTH